MIEFYAKEKHFEDHIAPVYHKLRDAGYEVGWVRNNETSKSEGGFAVVASYGDLVRATKDGKLVFFAEHGAGQTYNVRNSSYAGGPSRDNVCMFLSPGPHVTKANALSYPYLPSVAVGVPKLDNLHLLMTQEPEDPKPRPVVCFSFHWDCLICPETRSGFKHFKDSILALKGIDEYDIIGHCHPRARKEIEPFYAKYNIPFVEDFAQVLKVADIYVCDNSSTIFEFASIGKPVVLLNPPFYRKKINQGLRFWNFADLGPNADNTEEVIEAIRNVAVDTKDKKAYRLNRIKEVYYEMDGCAAERAAEAIVNYIEEMEKMKKAGNQVRCKRFSMGEFGMMDPGFTADVYEGHAVIRDKNGKLIRTRSLSGLKDPDERIKQLLKVAPRNYERVDIPYDPEEEESDPLDVPVDTKDFIPVDKSVSAEELYILEKVQQGESKTPIINESEKFRMTDLKNAWDKLVEDNAIEKDPDSKHGWRLTSASN